MSIDAKKAIFEANKLIITHDKDLSFNDLIEPNLEIFSKFKLMYSTNNTNSQFGYTSLDRIEEDCDSIRKFFHGSGLLFFSKDIYQAQQKQETVYIPLDYSLSFDSNVAEKFRVYEKGGKVQPKEKFERLIKFIKQYQFNFDYGFFCLENLEFIRQNNDRPFNTIRAIIRYNPLNSYQLGREAAGKLAIQTMYNPFNNEINPIFWQRRKLIYLILLKAVQINWELKEINSKLRAIIEFCLVNTGKYAKKEIYLAWKLFKQGTSLRFFNPVRQPSPNILSKVKGMSWDFLSIEYQSTLAYSMSRGNKFFVPFFASFDNKFVEFTEACPVRCMLFDDQTQTAHTFFDDELEFNQDISDAVQDNNKLLFRLTDRQKIMRGSNFQLNNNKLNIQIANLEKEISQM